MATERGEKVRPYFGWRVGGRTPGAPTCPSCGVTVEEANSVGHMNRPEPDTSITVCALCDAELIFRANPAVAGGLRLERLPPNELDGDPEARRLLDEAHRMAKIYSAAREKAEPGLLRRLRRKARN